MTGLQVLILIAGLWIGTVLLFRGVVVPWLRNGPRRSARLGAVWHAARAFVRIRHHPRFGLSSKGDHWSVVVLEFEVGQNWPFWLRFRQGSSRQR